MTWITGEKDIELLAELAVKRRKQVALEKKLTMDQISSQLYRLRHRYHRYRRYIAKIDVIAKRHPHIKRMLLPSKPPDGYLYDEEEEEEE